MTKLTRMYPRNPREQHRVASVLELFFDLVFVIAVSTLASNTHHLIEQGLLLKGICLYALIFEFIWWAWMNFTWFASSYDTDDWLYRVTTFIQMIGVLVLTAGIEPSITSGDYRLVASGYVVMRLAMVSQWLRAWKSTDPAQAEDGFSNVSGSPSQNASAAGQSNATAETATFSGTITEQHHINTPEALRARRASLVYAIGISMLQVAWVLWAFVVPPSIAATVLLFALIAGELAVCYLAERKGPTLWHPHHITERFGLFTIILLGETLLSSTSALLSVLHASHEFWHTAALFGLFLCSFIIIACLWWVYFWPTHHAALGSFQRVMSYGYLHYMIFAAVGFLSVGLETIVSTLEEAHISMTLGEMQYAHELAVPQLMLYMPVAIFLAGVWFLIARQQAPKAMRMYMAVCAVVLLAAIALACVTGLFALPVPVVIAIVVGFVRWQPVE